MTAGRRRFPLVGLLLVLAAVALRLHGLGWGLPEVYEEATPLHRAWAMWNGGATTWDFNPHFFNYPTLVIYLHLIWQVLQLVVFKALGLIANTLDYRIMFEVEKTPVYAAARLLTVLLGAGTVAVVWHIGRRLAGPVAGLAAAVLLAANPFHIDQSQLIAVDVPLTFLATVAIAAMLRLEDSGRVRNHLWIGLWIGLATSAKYTGAMLVPAYLLAHFLAARTGPDTGRRLQAAPLVWGLATAAVVFSLTSPFVILDLKAALHGLAVEGDHMRSGHFGGAADHAAAFYLRRLAGPLLGWPALLAAVAGVWFCLWRRRRILVVVLLVQILGYLWPISTWAMKADRYVLPALPLLTILAGCGVAALVEALRARGWSALPVTALGLAGVLLLTVPTWPAYPTLLARSRPDTRTTALRWIEAHIPAGSFILAEYFGPDLLRPATLLPLDRELQERLLNGAGRRPVYAVQRLPMFQSRPTLSAVYYDLDQYPDADYVLVSGSVRSRYAGDADRFGPQLAFYAELAADWESVREFAPEGGTGPRLVLYRNPRWQKPYAQRPGSPPRPLAPSAGGALRDEGFHFFSLGANAMTFNHPAHAEQAFRRGLHYAPLRPEVAQNLVLGALQVMSDAGRDSAATAFLDSLGRSERPEIRRAVSLIRGPRDAAPAGDR